MIPHPARPKPARLLFALLASITATAVGDDRPLLPEPSLGTGSAAFAGGGAGHAGGAAAVFVNPGALSIPAGSQTELGLMGLSEGPSPYTLFGARSGPNSYSLGYFHERRIGPYRNGVVAGAAREVVPGAAFGAAVRSQGGAGGFGVDADLGMLLRPRGWAVLGASVRNLAESGVGRKPEGYRTLRSYALSLGARRDEARFLFLPIHGPDAAYEVRADGMRGSGLSHTFSAGAGFTPLGALSLRGSLRMPHDGAAVVAVGGFLRFLLGTGGLLCGYTFSTGGFETGMAAPSHAFSLNLALGTRSDRQPPWLSVRADRVYLGSEIPGRERVHFRLQAADRAGSGSGADGGDEFAPDGVLAGAAPANGDAPADHGGELREWDLAIYSTAPDGRKDRPVKTFRGKDLPPRLIRWDGRDDGGRTLAPGYYAFRLAAEDKAGNRAETPWQLVEVGRLAEAEVAPPPSDGDVGRDSTAAEPWTEEPPEGPIRLPDIIEGDDG